MAYVSTVTLVAAEVINGRRHSYYDIVETGGGSGDACLVAATDVLCTVTLVEWSLTTPGTANTLQPALGVGTAINQFVSGAKGPTTSAAAATGRSPTAQHMVVPAGSSIIWKNNADTGTYTRADSRICIVEGHI